MSMSRYMRPRGTRREIRTLAGRFRGGKLFPAMAVPFRESESGVVDQTITFTLDPIPGYMITPIIAEAIAVYVPAQAMDALNNPDDAYPGNSEVFRQKMLSGSPVFGLEPEGDLSKYMGVVPRSISGVKMVNEAARLAHNCAVNYLRRQKYVDAVQLDASNTAVTPALIGQTVLDRLNAVLDPEDRVNGAVDLNIPSMELPVKGIGLPSNGSTTDYISAAKETGDTYRTYVRGNNGGSEWVMEGTSTGFPNIRAVLNATDVGSLSLTDFYRAQRMDDLTRTMREMVDTNPEYGAELVARFAHGLSVDVGKQPFVMYRSEKTFGMSMSRGMDGPNLDVTQSNLTQKLEFVVPVPPTEFGGIVVTFLVVKPDETISSQPHPVLSDSWGARNYVADELALDPVPVTVREVDGDCSSADENTVVFYTGNNELLRNYVNYGFNRKVDPLTVEAKTAVWQLDVPLSVTPESVLYPTDLDHYPFADQLAEVCTYTIQSNSRIDTPIIFGPTPVEELATIETEDVFEDAGA